MSWLPKGPRPCSACVMKPATTQKTPSQPRRRREARGIQRPVERATTARNGFGVQARAAALAPCKQLLEHGSSPPEFRINPKGSPGRKKEWESQRCCELSSGMWRPGVLHHQCPLRPALRLSGALPSIHGRGPEMRSGWQEARLWKWWVQRTHQDKDRPHTLLRRPIARKGASCRALRNQIVNTSHAATQIVFKSGSVIDLLDLNLPLPLVFKCGGKLLHVFLRQ